MRLGISVILACAAACAGDWTDWRGPSRNGTSPEKNLPAKWSPAGDNLAWRAPYGGRSAPVVANGRVYVLNPAGKDDTLQERVMCLDADTGKVLWEYKYNVFLSDVPPHRISWSSPAVDPETGNVYTFGVGGMLTALSRDGKKLWERSLTEEVGLVTTHGGRTVSPIVEGELVVVSGITTGWGDQGKAAHRFMAFDKRTGEFVYTSTPGGRPFDTTYSPPIVADVEGTRLLMAGGSDGTVHAIKMWTGEPVWRYEISKRGLNTGVGINGNIAIVSHSEENYDTNEMGLLAAIDARHKGAIGKEQIKWQVKNWQGGFSSPIVDGDRLYQIDNGANLYAFDVNTGKTLWHQNLGTIQKSSPVLADGKLYVASENGRFFILQPRQDKVEVLSQVQLGTEQNPEQVQASVAVSNGRVYLVTDAAIYAIGKQKNVSPNPGRKVEWQAADGAKPAFVQVIPAESVLKPGETLRFRVRSFDDKGKFIREESGATFAAEGVQATMSGSTLTAGATGSAGLVKATLGNLAGVARVRVIPPLPWKVDFSTVQPGTVPPFWINAAGKASVRDVEGKMVLVKHADNAFTKRARSFLGPTDWHDYTIEANVSAVEKRRQLGDAGLVAQRYNLILFGNAQRLELQSWQPETHRTVSAPFAWKPMTWYRMKLRVENRADGSVRALGKVWPTSEPEPDKWSIEKVEQSGNRQGAPGIYADAPFEVYFDNMKVAANQ